MAATDAMRRVLDAARRRPGLIALGAIVAVAGGVTWRSPVEASVAAGPGHWVVLDTPYEPGWSAGDGAAVELANGTVAVPVPPGRAALVSYRPWRVVEAGYALSGLAFLALSVAVGLERRGRRAGPVPGEQVP